MQATRQANVIIILMSGTKGKLMSGHKQHVFQQCEPMKSESFRTLLVAYVRNMLYACTGIYIL